MNVNTPTGAENWKNIEITGYAKINALVTNYNYTPNYDLTWYARGGRHNPDTPCEGTAYMGASTRSERYDGRKKFGLLVSIQTKEIT